MGATVRLEMGGPPRMLGSFWLPWPLQKGYPSKHGAEWFLRLLPTPPVLGRLEVPARHDPQPEGLGEEN